MMLLRKDMLCQRFTKMCFKMSLLRISLLVCLALGVSFLAAAVLTVIINPLIIISKYYTRVDYGTLVHKALSEEVDSVHISAYLFNITNADQFISGEDSKLKVQEVGPFTYQENRTNEDLEIDKEAGVIRYTPRHRVTFLPEESVGRPEDFMVNMPNIAMLSMASRVSSYGYLARVGFNMLTTRLRSNATVQMSAHDFLWGYDEPLIRLGNTLLPNWINFETLGLLDRLYDKNATYRMEVSARDEDKFMIKTVNGAGGLKQRGYPETRSNCNSFNGAYEGIGYPPELTPDRPIKIYRNVLCRFLELEYYGQKTMDFGVEGMQFKITNKSYSQIPDNECLCNKEFCYEGISDMSPCFYGLPLVLSNAHFWDASPSLYERIEGLSPNEEQHGSEFTIEPMIGMVMMTKFSVQVNVLVRDVGFNSKVNRFSDMIVPIMHLKIVQPKMQDEMVAAITFIRVYSPYILLSAQVLLVLCGLLLLAHSTRILYWNWISSRRKEIAFNTEKLDIKETLSNQPLIDRYG